MMWDTLLHKYLRIPYQLHIRTDKKDENAKATVLLLHGMGYSAKAWDNLIAELPENVRVISIDLLGFGQSPSPRWRKYSSIVQAKSVFATLLKAGIDSPLILVGHSMGSLVAIEIAKRYPLLVHSLVLCAPPLYSSSESKLLPSHQRTLRTFYKHAQENPQQFLESLPIGMKLKFIDESFEVTQENVDIYMAVLESCIIHQRSMKDLIHLHKPTTIIYGTLDPLIVKKNIKLIVKKNPRVTVSKVLSGHELNKLYSPKIVEAISKSLD